MSLHSLLNLAEGERINNMQLLMRGSMTLLIVLLVVAAFYTILYYRSVRRIPSKERPVRRGLSGLLFKFLPSQRQIMGLCHLLALAILITIVAMPAAKVRSTKTYRPTMLILVDTSRSMAEKDRLITPEALAEAAKLLGQLPLDQEVTDDVIRQQMKQSGEVSRLELVKALFAHPQVDLLRRAGERFDVRFFSFDRGLAPEGGTENAAAWLESCEPRGEASRIGSAVREAVSRYTGLPIAGVMVFSDFGWVEGEDPVRVAEEMERRGIPIYPIPIGLPAPPDSRITEIIAPQAVLKDNPVKMRVRLQSSGLDGQDATLKLKINGEDAQTVSVVLEEDTQFVDMTIQPEQSNGAIELDFQLDAGPDDSNPKNNTAKHRVRIIEEKIKVLYVEGMPRWEFRYLRWVLLRNPHLQTRFLMTQGDPDLAKISPHFMAGFPKDVKNIFEYDLIILGDVSPKYFKPEQLELLQTQIREHGGTLIVLAGSLHTPASYQDTPLEDILPVKIGVGNRLQVSANHYPQLPEEESLSPITTLADDSDVNQRLWSKVRPLNQLPSLDGHKSGAHVLLRLPAAAPGEPDYPVVSWHNYGKGKCMFIATDNLWRLRLEVGDVHHARFWGQTIEFLAMSRLLGQNKRISLQTERTEYVPGELVRIYATVLSDSYEPVNPEDKPSHTVVVEREGQADSAEKITLVPDPTSAGLYFGTYQAVQEGNYLLRAQRHEEEISSQVEFTAASSLLEDRDTSAKPEIAREMAEASGGTLAAPGELAGLIDNLPAQEMTRVVSRELELWDSPLLYLLLVMAAGLEWFLRRRENLL